MVLNVYEMRAKRIGDILESPIRVRPSSSGNGEAMIRAPRKAIDHRTNLNSKRCFIRFDFAFEKRYETSSDMWPLIKLNMMKSPTRAPNPPTRARTYGGYIWASLAMKTIAGAVVKAEVKNNPTTKELRI